MSIISWGRHQKVTFSSSGNLSDWAPPMTPTVFAVTYQRDPVNKPKGQTVLYFGETENPSIHAASIKRNMNDFWSSEGGRPEELFVFVHLMDGSSTPERSRIVERLVLEYQPQANRALTE
jgi:hypothetical protein